MLVSAALITVIATPPIVTVGENPNWIPYIVILVPAALFNGVTKSVIGKEQPVPCTAKV